MDINYLAKQKYANEAVQEYLSNKSDLLCAPIELKRSETIAINSLTYLVDQHTNKYKRYPDYDDLRQDAWMKIIYSLSIQDFSKSDSFTYLAALNLKQVKLGISKTMKRNDVIVLDETPNLFEQSRAPSAFKMISCKEKLSALHEDDKVILKQYLDGYSVADISINLNIAKELISETIHRLALQFGVDDFRFNTGGSRDKSKNKVENKVSAEILTEILEKLSEGKSCHTVSKWLLAEHNVKISHSSINRINNERKMNA